MEFRAVRTDPAAMEGRATLKEIDITFRGPYGQGTLRLVLCLPKGSRPPAPCFLLIANRSREDLDPAQPNPFWPAAQLIERGFSAAAFFNGDIAPDRDARFAEGVFPAFDAPGSRGLDAWAAIAAWAWGASRALDYLETEPGVDARRVALVGHSRGGKTALWAGAEDERFAMVVSNESGCTGAALARGKRGEKIADINRAFPYWFCENYKRFNGREAELPIDQHELLALIAPRLLYVSSATADPWSDPENEFRSVVHAGPVYRLFGLEPIAGSMRPPETPVEAGAMGYHLRTGEHDLTEYDWARFMDFAARRWLR